MKFFIVLAVSVLFSAALPFSALAQEKQAVPPVGGSAGFAPQTDPARQGQTAAGGYSEASLADPHVATAAAVAVKGERTRLTGNGGGQPQELELLAVVSAEQQVVAGINYRLILRVSHNGRIREAETVVLWRSWAQLPFEISSWTWR